MLRRFRHAVRVRFVEAVRDGTRMSGVPVDCAPVAAWLQGASRHPGCTRMSRWRQALRRDPLAHAGYTTAVR